MAARRRFTFAFPPELASNLEAAIPPRQRNQFVAEAIKARLRDLEREALRVDMEECARIMHDEIMQIEAEFAPLDAEVDRLLRTTLAGSGGAPSGGFVSIRSRGLNKEARGRR